MFSKSRLFQKSASAILIIFMGILVWVTIVAYMRQSGSTHQDMSKVQLLRKDKERHQVNGG
jgi:hypothetical protein